MSSYRNPDIYNYSYDPIASDSISGISRRLAELEESGGPGGTTDYEKLKNKPKINSVELVGDKSQEDLNIHGGSADVKSITREEIDAMWAD